jgi:hypothetical protein
MYKGASKRSGGRPSYGWDNKSWKDNHKPSKYQTRGVPRTIGDLVYRNMNMTIKCSKRSCGSQKLLKPNELISNHNANWLTPIKNLGSHFKCQKCGTINPEIILH